MIKVISDNERAQEHCRKYFPLATDPNRKGIILERDGEVIAATCYDSWNIRNIFMHCAGTPGTPWLNRKFIHESFAYPFSLLKVHRITCPVDASNAPSIRFLEHLGFQYEAALREAAMDGGDVLIYSMFRSQCRYIRGNRPGE